MTPAKTIDKAEIKRRIRSARRKRERAEQLLEEGTLELAEAAAAGRAAGALQMTEMAEIAGHSREHLYHLMREHGLA